MIDVTIPGLRLVSEANARGSWHGGATRAARQRSIVALVFRTLRCAVPCNVRIVRVAPLPLDDDNLARAAKAVRDELAEWLGVDDGDERVSWSVAQTKGGVREYAVRVIVRPWSPASPGLRIIRGVEGDEVSVVLTPFDRAMLAASLVTNGPASVDVGGSRVTFAVDQRKGEPREYAVRIVIAARGPVEASGTPAAGVVATSGRPKATAGAVGAAGRRRRGA